MTLTEFRSKLDPMIDNYVNEIFYEAQQLNNVHVGDIDPLHHCHVERTKIVLRELVIAQVLMNKDNSLDYDLGLEVYRVITGYDPTHLIIDQDRLPK